MPETVFPSGLDAEFCRNSPFSSMAVGVRRECHISWNFDVLVWKKTCLMFFVEDNLSASKPASQPASQQQALNHGGRQADSKGGSGEQEPLQGEKVNFASCFQSLPGLQTARACAPGNGGRQRPEGTQDTLQSKRGFACNIICMKEAGNGFGSHM